MIAVVKILDVRQFSYSSNNLCFCTYFYRNFGRGENFGQYERGRSDPFDTVGDIKYETIL